MINQLTKETLANGSSTLYTYDVVGNRLTKKVGSTETKYTYNAANQLIKVDSQTYTYDDNGNLTNDGKYKYTWNAFDQLTEVKTINGTTVATYKYDENGRRIYSKVGTIETYFRYDGTSNLVLFEEDANGTITKEYTYDNNGHPLTFTYNNQTYYYLTNYRGDVLGLTDANGEVVAEYTYDAWGNILTQSGTLVSINPYRYAGYQYDDETKLYYLMARYYNPDTGVFLSLDSVRGDVTNPITMNGYNYANNNPVMNVDPDGEFAQFVYLAYYTYIGYKTYKTVKKIRVIVQGGLKFTDTPYKHMKDASRYVPVSILKQVIRGKAYKDPRGSSAKMYYSKIYKNNKQYNLEVLYDPKNNIIYHFKYTNKAIGPLNKIR